MQCMDDCGAGIFPSEPYEVAIDEATMRAVPPLPACPNCGALARPNILMFGDGGWDSSHSDAQHRRLDAWLQTLGGASVVIVEMGAGMAVPTIRIMSEDFVDRPGGTLIRINPREPDVPAGHVALPMGALAALRAIDERLGASGYDTADGSPYVFRGPSNEAGSKLVDGPDDQVLDLGGEARRHGRSRSSSYRPRSRLR